MTSTQSVKLKFSESPVFTTPPTLSQSSSSAIVIDQEQRIAEVTESLQQNQPRSPSFSFQAVSKEIFDDDVDHSKKFVTSGFKGRGLSQTGKEDRTPFVSRVSTPRTTVSPIIITSSKVGFSTSKPSVATKDVSKPRVSIFQKLNVMNSSPSSSKSSLVSSSSSLSLSSQKQVQQLPHVENSPFSQINSLSPVANQPSFGQPSSFEDSLVRESDFPSIDKKESFGHFAAQFGGGGGGGISDQANSTLSDEPTKPQSSTSTAHKGVRPSLLSILSPVRSQTSSQDQGSSKKQYISESSNHKENFHNNELPTSDLQSIKVTLESTQQISMQPKEDLSSMTQSTFHHLTSSSLFNFPSRTTAKSSTSTSSTTQIIFQSSSSSPSHTFSTRTTTQISDSRSPTTESSKSPPSFSFSTTTTAQKSTTGISTTQRIFQTSSVPSSFSFPTRTTFESSTSRSSTIVSSNSPSFSFSSGTTATSFNSPISTTLPTVNVVTTTSSTEVSTSQETPNNDQRTNGNINAGAGRGFSNWIFNARFPFTGFANIQDLNDIQFRTKSRLLSRKPQLKTGPGVKSQVLSQSGDILFRGRPNPVNIYRRFPNYR